MKLKLKCKAKTLNLGIWTFYENMFEWSYVDVGANNGHDSEANFNVQQTNLGHADNRQSAGTFSWTRICSKAAIIEFLK